MLSLKVKWTIFILIMVHLQFLVWIMCIHRETFSMKQAWLKKLWSFCNIILLEDKSQKICFLSFDLLGLHYDSRRLIKPRISFKTGLDPKSIVISTTYTYSGPDVLDSFKEQIDSECLKYIENIAEKASAGIAAYPIMPTIRRTTKLRTLPNR